MVGKNKLGNFLEECGNYKSLASARGVLVLLGGIEAMSMTFDIASSVAPKLEKYIGPVGAAALEVAMPLAAAYGVYRILTNNSNSPSNQNIQS